MIELLSLWTPGPEIVLHRFDIIALLTLARHSVFQFHVLLSPDQGAVLLFTQPHTGCKKAMCPCSKAILIGNN